MLAFIGYEHNSEQIRSQPSAQIKSIGPARRCEGHIPNCMTAGSSVQRVRRLKSWARFGTLRRAVTVRQSAARPPPGRRLPRIQATSDQHRSRRASHGHDAGEIQTRIVPLACLLTGSRRRCTATRAGKHRKGCRTSLPRRKPTSLRSSA